MSSSVGPSQATSYDSQGATERKIMQISATKVNFTKKMRIIFFQQKNHSFEPIVFCYLKLFWA